MLKLPELCSVAGAITLKNLNEHAEVGAVIYVVTAWDKHIIIQPGRVLRLNRHRKNAMERSDDVMNQRGGDDVTITLKIDASMSADVVMSKFNGASSLLGEELPEANWDRIFFALNHAREYAEMIKFVREVQSEEIFGMFTRSDGDAA